MSPKVLIIGGLGYIGSVLYDIIKDEEWEVEILDAHLYKERHLIECFINKIKWYRRIFSRFDKLSSRFRGFLSFVASLIWLR